MDIKQIDKISEFATYCIQQDLRERHGILLRWEIIPSETRAAMVERWRGFIQGAIVSELQKSAIQKPDSAVASH